MSRLVVSKIIVSALVQTLESKIFDKDKNKKLDIDQNQVLDNIFFNSQYPYTLINVLEFQSLQCTTFYTNV